jgi:hypothetical protein
MSFENPLWGAPKIHGELLKLGIEVAESTVSIYMVARRDRPLQTWKTFLCNHMEGIASIDLFAVPTIAFEQLFAFLVLGHRRRQLLWIAVTQNPTAEWLARAFTHPSRCSSASKASIWTAVSLRTGAWPSLGMMFFLTIPRHRAAVRAATRRSISASSQWRRYCATVIFVGSM